MKNCDFVILGSVAGVIVLSILLLLLLGVAGVIIGIIFYIRVKKIGVRTIIILLHFIVMLLFSANLGFHTSRI